MDINYQGVYASKCLNTQPSVSTLDHRGTIICLVGTDFVKNSIWMNLF